MKKKEIAQFIDHTNLKATATLDQISNLCKEAIEYHFASVCVNPSNVKLCAGLLSETDIDVCTVIGFPLGATTTATKVFESKEAIQNGATELDMVINMGALKSENKDLVFNDIKAVVEVAKSNVVKVIIETCYLSEDEKILACKLASEAGADFVKTSTGFGTAGATVEDVSLMKSSIKPSMQVKAAGGIHSYQDALKMISAGATRIGASSGIKIVQEAE